jgi:hypothetical protein
MLTDRDRNTVIEELVRQFRKQLQDQIPQADQTLDQIEDMAGKIGRQVSQEIQERVTRQQSDLPRSPRQECSCGGSVRYKGEQPRTLVTAHGILTFGRAVYYCRACQKNWIPADVVLGLEAGTLTSQVRGWATYLGAMLPFGEAATTLELLTRVVLSASSLERVTVASGNALRQAQQEQTHAHQEDRLPDPTTKPPRRLYIGMDGVFAPLRDAWKQDGTSGKLTCRYGECKIGVVYEAGQDKSGRDSGVVARAYTATLQTVEAFGPALGALAHRLGHHQTRDVVVLGDGAAWIWQIAAKQFTAALQIVDFFHACQHLATVSEARFGKDSVEGTLWQQARQEDLKHNRLKSVLAEIRAWRPRSEGKRKLRATEYRYFVTNAERMRYQTFLEKGYHIGSGVVEASCKLVVTQRLKLAGMHWREETAEAVLAVRAAQLSTGAPDLRHYGGVPN